MNKGHTHSLPLFYLFVLFDLGLQILIMHIHLETLLCCTSVINPYMRVQTLFILEGFSRTVKTWPIFSSSMNHSNVSIHVASMNTFVVALITPVWCLVPVSVSPESWWTYQNFILLKISNLTNGRKFANSLYIGKF